MFVRMLTVHCDQSDSCEIAINGYQVRKINKTRNITFGLRYGKPFLLKFSSIICRKLTAIRYLQILDNLRLVEIRCLKFQSMSPKIEIEYGQFFNSDTRNSLNIGKVTTQV